MFERIGIKETLERAAELIGYGRDSRRTRPSASRVAGGRPSANSGCVRQAERRRHRTIITGAQENGSGAVMALPLWSPTCSVWSRRTSRSSTRTPTPARGTAAPLARRRRSTTAAPSSGRHEVREQLLDLAAEELEAPRERPRARRGRVRVKGSPASRSGSPSSPTPPLLGKGSGEPPETRRSTRRAASGARAGVVPGAAAHHARRAREGRPRDGRRARSAGRRRPRLRRDRQPHWRERPGLRRRRHGNRPGALGGHSPRRGGTAAQPAPPRLQARDRPDAPRSTSTGSRRAAERGPKGSKGVGEPPCVPTPGAIANAIARATGARVRQLPMTPERGGRRPRAASERGRTRRLPTCGRPRALAGGARPVAGGADLVVGARQGKAPLPDRLVAIHGVEALRGIEWLGGGSGSGRSRPTGSSSSDPVIRERSPPRRRVGHRRLARDSCAGDDRRQPDERLAGDGDRRPARLPGCGGHASLRGGRAAWRSPICSPARADDRRSPDELLLAVEVPPRRKGREAATPGSSTGARWRSRWSAQRQL